MDRLSRWADGAAIKDTTSEMAAEFIYENIVTRYGCPLSLRSDHGSHFVNLIIRTLREIWRVKHHLSTPYYSQSNGKIERVDGTIKTIPNRTLQEAVEVEEEAKEETQRAITFLEWVPSLTRRLLRRHAKVKQEGRNWLKR